MLSVLDIFRIGIGPSSSHTVGPMRIAKRFLRRVRSKKMLADVNKIQITLQGSLAFTGKGHATPKAVILGLAGLAPETLTQSKASAVEQQAQSQHKIHLLGEHEISFNPDADIIFDYETVPDLHPNSMVCSAYSSDGRALLTRTFCSTGGGFIASRKQLESPVKDDIVSSKSKVPYPFTSAQELLQLCSETNLNIADIVLQNELSIHSGADIAPKLDKIFEVMMASIDRGLETTGTLPGELQVKRRAPKLWEKLNTLQPNEPEILFDWLNVYAMAVNEENANGGQVVTAPTNGASGIIPSVMRHYCLNKEDNLPLARQFLLTAGGIGLLYKQRASISGAEMGCQGEVGVACSMAAGGLAAIWGGTSEQIFQAAEIGMEHNLGLTCDPVGGLVQIPCIERNAIGAVKAANAARLALHEKGAMKVSLDQVIETMRQTGLDMNSKYKETSLGGLAVNVVEC